MDVGCWPGTGADECDVAAAVWIVRVVKAASGQTRMAWGDSCGMRCCGRKYRNVLKSGLERRGVAGKHALFCCNDGWDAENRAGPTVGPECLMGLFGFSWRITSYGQEEE